MKKIISLLLIAGAIITAGCSKSDSGELQKSNSEQKPDNQPQTKIKEKLPIVTMEVRTDESLENVLYPSFFYSIAKKQQQEKTPYFYLSIDSDKEFQGRIKIRNDKFINEIIVDKSILRGNTQIEIAPLWRYDNFINIDKPGYTHFNIELIDFKTDKLITTKTIEQAYRSINECVYAAKDSKGEIIDFTPFFAAYVNEDSKVVESFLKEVSDYWSFSPKFKGWLGYQLGKEYVLDQIIWVALYLKVKGMKYSSITRTSNTSSKIFSQNVRFVENTIANKQANCVDGSVLLASVFEKIGLTCFLVTEPSHMYLAVGNKLSPEYRQDYILIETTAIGTGSTIFKDWTEMDSKAKFIDIREARIVGIKPIQ